MPLLVDLVVLAWLVAKTAVRIAADEVRRRIVGSSVPTIAELVVPSTLSKALGKCVGAIMN